MKLPNLIGIISKVRMPPGALPASLILILTAGCMSKPAVPPKTPPSPPKTELTRMGYSIQLGAFSNLSNAMRLTQSLEHQGLNAYYFQHKTGLYKVRFGNFISDEAAIAKAESLITSGIIDAYYIVSPDDYAVAKSRNYGGMDLRNEIVETAETFIGLPYQWGGSSADEGFDCSGLTMAVYHLNGLNLPRASKEQYRVGSPVERNDLVKGDLVFFAISGGNRVSHVGVYAGDDSFIHAPGRGKTVRVDSLSNTYFEARYAGARSYLN